MDGVEIVAVCDPDRNVLDSRAAGVKSKSGKAPRKYDDTRRLIDDKDVDALVVSSPDHWHAPTTIWGCQAGKDVYVEKPCAHNVQEALWMVEAAKKYKRVVQHGTQSRSSHHIADAIELIQKGTIGPVRKIRVINSQRRANIGKKNDAPTPKHVNYDIWLGPAAERPFNPNRFHYNWHWFWDYGTGDLGNDGAHSIDVAQWVMGDPGLPNAISCGGGKFHFDDDQQTPDTQMVVYDYDDKCVLFEQRLWSPYGEQGIDNGCIVYGEKGYIALHRAKDWQVVWANGEKGPAGKWRNDRGKDHRVDFIDCMRTRKSPRADIRKGAMSSILCLLGNLSYRVKRRLEIDRKTMGIQGDAEANRLLGRDYRKGFELDGKI